MAEALVSMALETLKSILSDELSLVMNATKELQKLETKFTTIRDVLEDAEEKQFKDKVVKGWLHKLKDVAYDIDDLLDEWRFKSLSSNKVHNCPSPCFCFNDIIKRHSIGNTIKEIKERLEDIATEKDDFQFVIREEKKMIHVGQLQTISYVKESNVFGRDDEKETLISKLLIESGRDSDDIPVISIVGMGGLGKTTLAQLLYNDSRVAECFDKKIWVCVSYDFDLERVVKAIIESATMKPSYLNELPNLRNRLEEILSGKKYMVILDDVWNEDPTKWESLRDILNGVGINGSKIVVTTRKKKVARVMNASYTHHIGVLSPDFCWSLFCNRAFSGWANQDRLEFEEIGRQIVLKCKGVPLAVKTVGASLQSKRTKREWEHVLESDTWASDSGILPALLLSYYNLPPHLKQCFTYCSIFPKDSRIIRDTLIEMWMAQGFISSDGTRDMENIGATYCDELLGRSLLAQVEHNEGNYMMHDLVHDLACSISIGECSIMHMETPDMNNIEARHCNLMGIDKTFVTNMCKTNKVRTLLLRRAQLDIRILDSLFLHLRYIRTLDLRWTGIENIPSSIESCIHLRYLDLCGTNIRELPESVINLLNLQTLNLTYINGLHRLPSGIGKMVSLRHLRFGKYFMKGFPEGLGRLTSLRTLPFFWAGGEGECKIGELKELDLLRGNFCIHKLDGAIGIDEAREAKMMNKKYIQSLELEWDVHDERTDERIRIAEGVLEGLQPHKNLEELTIRYYIGSKFPGWIEDPIFSSLVSVELIGCNVCTQLPALGKLKSLKYLKIDGMHKVRVIGEEFYGVKKAFPKLEELTFTSMEELEWWELRQEDGTMSSLQSLTIGYCPNLRSLPRRLPMTLQKLILCRNLESSAISETLESLPNLTYLELGGYMQFTSLPKWVGQLKALQTLVLNKCNFMTSLGEEIQDLTSLKRLFIYDCQSLGREELEKVNHIPFLTVTDDFDKYWKEIRKKF